MRWHRRHLLAALLATVSWPALGQSMGLGLDIGSTLVAGRGAPLDGFQTPQAAYSLRKLLSSYTGPAIQIRRNSDQGLLDIGFVGFVPGLGSPLDVAAAQAHCAATTCSVRSWYDQTNQGFTISSGTAANQPLLTFNCIGVLPCLEISTASTSHTLVDGNITPATGIVSLSAVARRMVGTNVCVFIKQTPGNRLGATSANNWGGPGSTPVTPAADGVWHAATSVINGASSVIDMDGVRTTGSATGTVTAGQPGFTGTNTIPCSLTEGIIWDNYILPQAASAALIANQRAFWGF